MLSLGGWLALTKSGHVQRKHVDHTVDSGGRMKKLGSLSLMVTATAVALFSSSSGCSSDPAATPIDPYAGVAEGCDPLVPEHCGYPFPNDLWRTVGGDGKAHLEL